jgi:hypothetical protein
LNPNKLQTLLVAGISVAAANVNEHTTHHVRTRAILVIQWRYAVVFLFSAVVFHLYATGG